MGLTRRDARSHPATPVDDGARLRLDLLLCVDAVHGLGVEDATATELGCDVYLAGCHKWRFGPRGTGMVWAGPAARAALTRTIPTFTRGAGWGGRNSPGGFKSFEHLWVAVEAFEFHERIGKDRVAARIHGLNA